MGEKDYQQKKRECWEEYKRENLDGEVQWQPVSRYDVFCAAFDRAYALGKEKEAITKDDVKVNVAMQWNSVNDKLPQVDDLVLVYVPTIFKDISRYEVAYWDGEDWYTTVGEHIRPSRWMTIHQLKPEKEER